jgi:acyl-CoA thioester hydrolase
MTALTLRTNSLSPTAFVWPVRVYWEDTDAGGVVFYANYLKFFERARTEWLRHLGIEQQALRDATQGMFVVAHTEVSYLLSARLDDLLKVTTRVGDLGRSRIVLHQQAWRGEELLCEGSITIGWVNSNTLRPTRIPLEVSQALQGPTTNATP